MSFYYFIFYIFFFSIAKKSAAQKMKDKEESDRASVSLYFTLYLEKFGIDRKLLHDER